MSNRTEGNAEPVLVGLRIAGAISNFWEVRGYYTEGREQLSELLDRTEKAYRDTDASAGEVKEYEAYKGYRARALYGAGVLASSQGDHTSARQLLGESQELYRELGDKRGLARSLSYLATVWRNQGELTVAMGLYEESLALRREIGDKPGIARSLTGMGLLAHQQGDLTTARALHEESLALRREIGEEWGVAMSLNLLGSVALEQGDYVLARSLYEESLAANQETGNRRGIAICLNSLGGVAREQGDYTSSLTFYRVALIQLRDMGNRRHAAASLAGLGEVAVSIGHAAQGAKLLAAVEALLQRSGAVMGTDDRVPYERAVAIARAELGQGAFGTAWQEGRAMSLEQAIQYALEDQPGIKVSVSGDA